MAIKYYCDLCETEVQRQSLLFPINMEEVDREDARTLNRYDTAAYIPKVHKDICFKCRVAIIDFFKTLSIKLA